MNFVNIFARTGIRLGRCVKYVIAENMTLQRDYSVDPGKAKSVDAIPVDLDGAAFASLTPNAQPTLMILHLTAVLQGKSLPVILRMDHARDLYRAMQDTARQWPGLFD